MPAEYWFDERAADDAERFFRICLKHQKGELAGRPFVLDEWQLREIIRPMFGWKRADGTRKYRTVYVEVPRKNGKTSLAAGVGLYLLFADGEEGAEVYSAAADREQAAIAFDLAKSMVRTNDELTGMAQLYRRSIVVQATGSSYKVISADAKTKHGFNAHGIIFDEVHAQPNRELYDVLHTSTGARRQPIEFLITTAGLYDPESIAWQLHEYALKVNDGTIDDPAFLGVVYSAPMDADYREREVWTAANPGLGRSVKAEYLEAEAKKAEAEPSYENTFRRLHLGQWTQQLTRWIKVEDWAACAAHLPSLAGRPCYAGLDLSTTQDITALSLVFPPESADEPYYVLPFFWCPEDTVLKRGQRDRVPFDAWVRDGWMQATPGATTDYGFVRQKIVELAREYRFASLAYDPWNATHLATQLTEDDGLPCVEFRQGFQSMNEPSKEFERLVVSRQLRHDDNPVLNWMLSNVTIKSDPAGNIKPDKARSTGRIDGVVATVMGIGMAIRQAPAPSYQLLFIG